MVCAILRSGKIEISKGRLIIRDNQYEKNDSRNFNIKIGMLFGPVDLFSFKDCIIFPISLGVVGERYKELLQLTISFPFNSNATNNKSQVIFSILYSISYLLCV